MGYDGLLQTNMNVTILTLTGTHSPTGTDAILYAMLKDEAQACIKDPSEARNLAMIEDTQVS